MPEKNVYEVIVDLGRAWPHMTDEQKAEICRTIGATDIPTIVCNHCGKPLDEWDLQEEFNIHKRVGYGSAHDLEEIDLHLCCDCFDKLVDSCKVSPVLGECRLVGECSV